MFSILNVGSFLFGIVAWAIPVILLVTNKSVKNTSIMGIFFSLVCVIISLLMQMIYTIHLADISDWSALMDTQASVVLTASVLSIITIALNGIVIHQATGKNLVTKLERED